MCQLDHVKYCINYRVRHGIFGLNYAVDSYIEISLVHFPVPFLKKSHSEATFSYKEAKSFELKYL